jgi:hypothetical protein
MDSGKIGDLLGIKGRMSLCERGRNVVNPPAPL